MEQKPSSQLSVQEGSQLSQPDGGSLGPGQPPLNWELQAAGSDPQVH
jgi:hypothetical protein